MHWYDAKAAFGQAARALRQGSLDDLFGKTRAKFGPPWTKDHKLAMAAAIAATTSE